MMSKDEIRERVGGSAQKWRDKRTGRIVSVISLVGMNYEYLRLRGYGGRHGSKIATESFFQRFEKLGA
jgi:hypothetical protein